MVKKIIKILEQYVQWAALGVGVLFLAYVAWVFLINNPAAKDVTIGGTKVVATSANVDGLVLEQAQILEQRTGGSHGDFAIKVEIPTDLQMNPAAAAAGGAVASAQPAWDAWPFDVSAIGGAANNGGGAAQQQAVTDKLPELPALNYLDNETMRTVVMPVVDATGNGPHQDMDAVTTFWSLPMEALTKAFKSSFGALPASQQTVQFVRASVVRQEQLADGSWGPEQAVEAPYNVPKPAPAYPNANGPQGKDQFAQYRTWLIGPPSEQINIVAAPFPAAAYPDRADMKWRVLEDWIPYRAGSGAGAPAPAAPAAPAGLFAPVAPAPAQPAAAAVAAPVAAPEIPKLIAVPDAAFNPSAPAPAAAAGASAAAGVLDMELWFHDLKTEPGKTYRYKVQYTVANPVFNQPGMVKDSKLADAFGIDSAWSDWSKPVTIAGRTRFFLVNKAAANGNGRINPDIVDCTVYTWHDGQWNQHDYSAMAGDEIGANEGPAAGNFLTHWTLLDVQSGAKDSGSRFALLTPDTGGIVQKRDIRTDETSDEYTKFMKDVAATPANGAAAAGQVPAAAAAPAPSPVAAVAPVKPAPAPVRRPPPPPAPVFIPPADPRDVP
jgi:hypothetical protein